MIPEYLDFVKLGYLETIGYELSLTLTYSSYLFLAELLSLMLKFEQFTFWCIFILIFADSLVHDSYKFVGYISISLQFVRVLTNIFSTILGASIAFLMLNSFGTIHIIRDSNSNEVQMHFSFNSKTNASTIGFGLFLWCAMGSLFTVARTVTNFTILFCKLIVVLLGKIVEIEDEIPIGNDNGE